MFYIKLNTYGGGYARALTREDGALTGGTKTKIDGCRTNPN